MSSEPWTWDETLYAGSAPFYSVGRMSYPDGLAEALRRELGLDGSQRLLDVGCGPGSLTLLLAPFVATAVGIDADCEMVREAARGSSRSGQSNVSWRHMRAEELPADLGEFELVTFAQSFHWMDRPAVAVKVRMMLTPGVYAPMSTPQRIEATTASIPSPIRGRPTRRSVSSSPSTWGRCAERAGGLCRRDRRQARKRFSGRPDSLGRTNWKCPVEPS
jgi:SAM-dependent methyltransferase